MKAIQKDRKLKVIVLLTPSHTPSLSLNNIKLLVLILVVMSITTCK